MRGVVCEQRRSDEKEQRGERNIKQAAHPDAPARLPIRGGGVVALDITLIDAEILEMRGKAVDQYDPERGLPPLETEAAEAEFVVCRGDF